MEQHKIIKLTVCYNKHGLAFVREYDFNCKKVQVLYKKFMKHSAVCVCNNHFKIVYDFFQILFNTFYYSTKRILSSLSVNAVTLSVQKGLKGRNLTQSNGHVHDIIDMLYWKFSKIKD